MNFKEFADKFKSKLTLNALQCKVRDVTSYEEFGPTTQDMRSIVDAMAQSNTNFNDVCRILWKRLFDDTENDWVRVYKSLKLLHYIILHGSTNFIDYAKGVTDHLRHNFMHYTCLDKEGRDQGINVRSRVCEVLDLLSDDDALYRERTKSKEIQDKIGPTVVLGSPYYNEQSSDGMISSIVESFRSLKKNSRETSFNSPFSNNPPRYNPHSQSYSDYERKAQLGAERVKETNSSVGKTMPPIEGDLLCLEDLPTPNQGTTSTELNEIMTALEQSSSVHTKSKDLIMDGDFGDFVSFEPDTGPDWGNFMDGIKIDQKKERSDDSYDPFASIVESLKRN